MSSLSGSVKQREIWRRGTKKHQKTEKGRRFLRERMRRYRLRHPEKARARYLQRYKLKDNICVFCGRTKNLERGHLDYEDNGVNWVTVCKECNFWMEVK